MIATSTGVYGNTEQQFFDKIVNERIDVFIDIRQRRGVRGSKYKFVNSVYLQNKLKELGIGYKYIRELAPTSEIRNEQKLEDNRKNESKSSRIYLSKIFVDRYNKDIIANFNFGALIENFRGKKVVFFCVEGHSSACHRSLVLEYLQERGINCYHF